MILSSCAHRPDSHHNVCNVILSCCAHKFDFHHNLCIVILSCCAHELGYRRNLCIVIFSCCAHKFDFHHNLFHFGLCLPYLHLACCFDFSKHFMRHFVNCDVFLFLKHLNDKKCLHFVHCFFSILISHQAHEKYEWSLKIKWTIQCLLMKKPFQ